MQTLAPPDRATAKIDFRPGHAIPQNMLESIGHVSIHSPMENITSLKGPVESIDGRLVLRIPLAAGGNQLIECSRGIGEVDGECLNVSIPDWLADKLGIEEGSQVRVDNSDGKSNIHPVNHRAGPSTIG